MFVLWRFTKIFKNSNYNVLLVKKNTLFAMSSKQMNVINILKSMNVFCSFPQSETLTHIIPKFDISVKSDNYFLIVIYRSNLLNYAIKYN